MVRDKGKIRLVSRQKRIKMRRRKRIVRKGGR